MQVEFYVFEGATEQQIDVALCHLIEQWYQKAWTVAVLCQSMPRAQKFDQLLWSFNDQSFIPHEINTSENVSAPIVLCLDLIESSSYDVIVNLSKFAITSATTSRLLIEIVFPDQTMQQLARERYKQYRDLGFQLKTIKTPVSKVSASCR